MISVCAVMKGMPVGMRRNSAVTANQSAMPPTIAASATARSASTQRFSGSTIVARKTAAAAASSSEALRLARPSWASLASKGRLLSALARHFLALHPEVVLAFDFVQLARILLRRVEPGAQPLVQLLGLRRTQVGIDGEVVAHRVALHHAALA